MSLVVQSAPGMASNGACLLDTDTCRGHCCSNFLIGTWKHKGGPFNKVLLKASFKVFCAYFIRASHTFLRSFPHLIFSDSSYRCRIKGSFTPERSEENLRSCALQVSTGPKARFIPVHVRNTFPILRPPFTRCVGMPIIPNGTPVHWQMILIFVHTIIHDAVGL